MLIKAVKKIQKIDRKLNKIELKFKIIERISENSIQINNHYERNIYNIESNFKF